MADPHSLLGSPAAYATVVPGTSTLITGWTALNPLVSDLTGCCAATSFDRNVSLITSDTTVKQGAITKTQWVDLTGGREGITGGFFGNGIEQTFSLVAGQPYRLSYWVGSLYAGDGGNNFSNDALVEVRLNGAVMSTGLAPAPASPLGYQTQWYPFSFAFTPTASSNTITFRSLQPAGFSGGAVYAGLDDVSVTAVPEPSAYVLALAGLGVLGLAARRRRAG